MDPIVAALKEFGPAMLGWALFAIFCGGLIRGKFVFASQVESMRGDANERVDQAIRETDRWHQLTLTQVGIINDLTRQNSQLLDGTRIAVDVAAALPPAARGAPE